MIVFKKITWMNFLSTGQIPVEIELSKNNHTLIVGSNGSGKSTMLDALCFSLFGKAFRNITKPSLVNTLNNKELLVEIEFSIGPDEYKISRGIKPTIFEIYKNNVMLNQDAASRDYQKYLEETILKLFLARQAILPSCSLHHIREEKLSKTFSILLSSRR